MWEDAIPERTLVVLSGRDILAPTAHLNKWLSEHTHAQVRWFTQRSALQLMQCGTLLDLVDVVALPLLMLACVLRGLLPWLGPYKYHRSARCIWLVESQLPVMATALSHELDRKSGS